MPVVPVLFPRPCDRCVLTVTGDDNGSYTVGVTYVDDARYLSSTNEADTYRHLTFEEVCDVMGEALSGADLFHWS